MAENKANTSGTTRRGPSIQETKRAQKFAMEAEIKHAKATRRYLISTFLVALLFFANIVIPFFTYENHKVKTDLYPFKEKLAMIAGNVMMKEAEKIAQEAAILAEISAKIKVADATPWGEWRVDNEMVHVETPQFYFSKRPFIATADFFSASWSGITDSIGKSFKYLWSLFGGDNDG